MKTTSITRLSLILALASSTPLAFAQNDRQTPKPAAQNERETAKPTTQNDRETARPTSDDKAASDSGTITASLRDSVTFSILTKALVATGLDSTLGSKGTYTVFAPTDEAFSKLPEGTLDKLLLPANKEKLRSLLMYHVVPGVFMAAELKNGEIKTANGEKVEIDIKTNTVQIEDSKVAKADLVVSNGVIHSLDKVMVPKSLDGFADLDED